MKAKGAGTHAVVTNRLSICFLGLGILFAWNVSITYSFSWVTIGPFEVNSFILFIRCLAYIFCAICYKKATSFVQHKRVVVTLSILGALATYIYVFIFSYSKALSIPVLIFCAPIIGFTQACLMLSWYEIYAQMNFWRICIYFALSNIIASCIPFGLSFLEINWLSSYLMASFPLIGAGMYFACKRKELLSTQEDGRERLEIRWSFPVRPMVLMIIIALMMGFTRCLQSTIGSNISLLGHILSSVFLFVIAFFIPTRFNLKILYLLALPFGIVGTFCSRYSSLEIGAFGSFCTNASMSFFFLFTIILLCNISYRYGISVLWLVGFAEAAKLLGMFIGIIIGTYVSDINTDTQNVSLITDAIVVVLVIAFTVFLTEKDYKGTWGTSPVDAEISQKVELINATHYESFLDSCARIARQFGLTRREEEVLILLAQNKSVPSIEKELFITNATAKSHCHNIYSKMGIHRKQELIDIVLGKKLT